MTVWSSATESDALVGIQLGGLREIVTSLVRIYRCLQSIFTVVNCFLCDF